MQTACAHREFGFFSAAQAELIRVPHADGTLVKLPVGTASELLPSLLTLADVYGTGYHAAKRADVTAGDTVAVIADGAVGLLAILSAKQLGAERIILTGRHKVRTDLGLGFGATDVVAERGEEGIATVRGRGGALKVLEAVWHRPAYDQAVGIVRAGGIISRVGVPQYGEAPVGFASLFGRNITLNGGPAPVRAYIDELMPGVLNGTVNPARSSTAPSHSTTYPPPTKPWTTARPSRSSPHSDHSAHDGRGPKTGSGIALAPVAKERKGNDHNRHS